MGAAVGEGREDVEGRGGAIATQVRNLRHYFKNESLI